MVVGEACSTCSRSDEPLKATRPIRLTNPGRTVVDCFKFRNKIGLDVAIEALREAYRERRIRLDDLWRYATLCRVANVMRPYMEALGAKP